MEAVMRAPLSLRLCSMPLSLPSMLLAQRQFTTTTTKMKKTTKIISPRGHGKIIKKHLIVRRFIPEDARKFVTSDGRLMTNPQNEAFILEHDLEPDNGTMVKLAGKDLGRVASEAGTTIAFSPRHVISPYDLKYFDPRGHPLVGAVQQRYAENSKSRPLWIIVTVASDASAVVRTTASKKLKSAIISSLEKLGYTEAIGRGQGRQIKGTLWFTIHSPVTVVSMSEVIFGSAVANYLHTRLSKGVRQPSKPDNEP